MPRRLPSALRQHRARIAPGAAPASLETCVHCRRDAVVPVDWEPAGRERWWIFLRCAECGVSREVVVSDAIAMAYDEHLAEGQRAIGRALAASEEARLAAEVEAFAAALQRDELTPAHFAA